MHIQQVREGVAIFVEEIFVELRARDDGRAVQGKKFHQPILAGGEFHRPVPARYRPRRGLDLLVILCKVWT